MSENPTIHVTNWPSRKLHGPGRKFTIMAKPRSWEHGDGRVDVLCPRKEDLNKVQSGEISKNVYRQRFLSWLKTKDQPLSPGHLMALTSNGEGVHILDGDTLCCACSKDVAARGECHRVWAAEILRENGWHVILDGKEI